MIKCYFVDVKGISSDVPRSSFSESSLEKIADSILDTDGLICPLILQETGIEKYTVIEGHQEYYAAVIAKEKNINKAEMVNAFVIPANTRSAAIEQLNLLRKSPTNTVATPPIDRHILTEVLSSTIDRLLPSISASIATQLEPIVMQLAEQKQILDVIIAKPTAIVKPIKSTKETNKNSKKSKGEDTLSAPALDIPEPPQQQDPTVASSKKTTKSTQTKKVTNKKSKAEDILPSTTLAVEELAHPPDPIAYSSIKASKKPTETKKAASKDPKISKLEDALPSPTLEIAEPPKQPELTVASSVKITDPNESNKVANLSGSIDLDRPANALNLINTLDPAQLKFKLERSGVATAKTAVKLVEIIVTNRSIQPEQKFESWDTIIDAKITGFGAVVIKKIIDKLK